MPIDDKDFYIMQGHMQYQDEKLVELKDDVAKMQEKLDMLLEDMHQRKGSMRVWICCSALFVAILSGVSEYVLYYILQK